MMISAPAFSNQKSTAEAEKLFIRKCTLCHGMELIKSKIKSREGWAAAVKRMRGYADVLTDDDAEIITDYLFERYGHYED